MLSENEWFLEDELSTISTTVTTHFMTAGSDTHSSQLAIADTPFFFLLQLFRARQQTQRCSIEVSHCCECNLWQKKSPTSNHCKGIFALTHDKTCHAIKYARGLCSYWILHYIGCRLKVSMHYSNWYAFIRWRWTDFEFVACRSKDLSGVALYHMTADIYWQLLVMATLWDLSTASRISTNVEMTHKATWKIHLSKNAALNCRMSAL